MAAIRIDPGPERDWRMSAILHERAYIADSLRRPVVRSLAVMKMRDSGQKLEDRQPIEHAIETRRGGIWLELTEEQYRK
jgi:hypothetical protein